MSEGMARACSFQGKKTVCVEMLRENHAERFEVTSTRLRLRLWERDISEQGGKLMAMDFKQDKSIGHYVITYNNNSKNGNYLLINSYCLMLHIIPFNPHSMVGVGQVRQLRLESFCCLSQQILTEHTVPGAPPRSKDGAVSKIHVDPSL